MNMNDEDAKWINEHMEDGVKELKTSVKTFGFYSTDGKLTFSFEAVGNEEMVEGDAWARRRFQQALAQFGSKQGTAVREYKKAESIDEGLGTCPKCNAPMKMSQKGKPYCSKLCWQK